MPPIIFWLLMTFAKSALTYSPNLILTFFRLMSLDVAKYLKSVRLPKAISSSTVRDLTIEVKTSPRLIPPMRCGVAVTPSKYESE